MAFAVAGFFLLGCLLVVLGIAIYFWLEEPRRVACLEEPRQLAIDRTTYKIIVPQPLHVSLTETNVVMLTPPLEAQLSGAAAHAAIWINGKVFESGGRAAWELVRDETPFQHYPPGNSLKRGAVLIVVSFSHGSGSP